ncbi:putative immunity protein [Candidatus Methanomassiliicoccus intestinalis]|uniref:putative immunity protein n=1 Tax=Candidatus Methanomassiliicoccus intestinalis TaxID=1406512 RepID=UPI0037DC0E8F
MKVKFAEADIFSSLTELVDKQDQKTLAVWAADCAEHVLLNFTKNCPDDERPKLAIEAARQWVKCELSMSDARSAAFNAHAAARKLEAETAAFAARAAGHAAATAHVAEHALHASTYAVKSVFYAAPKESALYAVNEEREWQYQHLLELINN